MDNFNLESKEGMQEPIGMLREGVGGGGGGGWTSTSNGIFIIFFIIFA